MLCEILVSHNGDLGDSYLDPLDQAISENSSDSKFVRVTTDLFATIFKSQTLT